MTREERFSIWIRHVYAQAEVWGDEFDPERLREDDRARTADKIARVCSRGSWRIDGDKVSRLIGGRIEGAT